MTEYIVEAKSRNDIRRLTREFRKLLQLDNCVYIPIVKVLEVMPRMFRDFNFEIVEDNELPLNIHANTDILTGHIRIKQSVYDGACDGKGRDRMTIAHEIGHYLMLCICGFKLERNFGNEKVSTCCNPEWQAKCFAGELLVGAHIVKGMSAEAISDKCGVSLDAARLQYKHI